MGKELRTFYKIYVFTAVLMGVIATK